MQPFITKFWTKSWHTITKKFLNTIVTIITIARPQVIQVAAFQRLPHQNDMAISCLPSLYFMNVM
jgi:hypothetical protein